MTKTVKIVLTLLLGAVSAFAQPPAKVVVAKVFEKELARTNPIVGIADFDRQSGISSEISGLIEQQFLSEGAVVKKGDILVVLNTDFIRKSMEIVKKQIAQAEVKIRNTKKNVGRYEVLFKKDAVSEKVYDDLKDSYSELRIEKEILRKNMEKLDLELKKSSIRAPFDGLILEKHRNEGEWISPGTPVCTLASVEDMTVKVAVSEELVRYIRPGSEVSLKINALDREMAGTVRNFVPVADIKSKTFQVKIAIPHFEEAIQNMTATVNIAVSDKTRLKMIKRDALVRFQGKNLVYTVKDGKAAPLPVHIAAYEGEYVGVDDPHIAAGMPVVIDGNDRLRPDQAVEVVEKQGEGEK